jgi:CDP-diacylglycerol pyrophosphatase
MKKSALALACTLVLAACQLPPAVSSSAPSQKVSGPNALWIIVSQRCVPDEEQHGLPAPCTVVDRTGSYAILKDIRGKSQYLLIPTTPVRGIETPALLEPGAPPYFAFAWSHRQLVSTALNRKLPDDAVGLAINPIHARTQEQLHIHIDCVAPTVRQQLTLHANQIGAQWTSIEWRGRTFHVLKMPAAKLRTTNLFRLVDDTVAGARDDMGGETIFVTGAARRPGSDPGVYIVEGNFDTSGQARWAAEDLLDHSCGILTEPDLAAGTR